MTLRHLIICALFALWLATPGSAQSPTPDTPQGFQQQYHAAFEAFQQHNPQAMQDRLDTFAIPARWFAGSFASNEASDWARQYADQFAEFKRHTADNSARIDALKARLQMDPATPVDIRTRRWIPADSKPMPPIPNLRVPLPPVEKFEIDYVLAAPGQGARLTSWIDSFIYVDGAFRFFARGSAFWTSPAQHSREFSSPKP